MKKYYNNYEIKVRTNKPVCLADEIDSVINHFGLDEKLQELKILNVWEECVGKTIAKYSRPVELKKTKLLVSVENASWRYELSIKKTDIIASLNKKMRELKTGKFINDIIFI